LSAATRIGNRELQVAAWSLLIAGSPNDSLLAGIEASCLVGRLPGALLLLVTACLVAAG